MSSWTFYLCTGLPPSHCSLGWHWRDDLGSESVSFVSRDVTSFSGVLSNLLLLSVFSLFRTLQFLWQSSTVSPTSSLTYLICANSPILITSHSKHFTGIWSRDSEVSTVTGCTVRGSNSGRGRRCYLAKTCPDRGWDPPSQLFSGYEGSFLAGCSKLCSLPAHSPPSSIEVNNE